MVPWGGGGGVPFKKDGCARRTLGLKTQLSFLLGCSASKSSQLELLQYTYHLGYCIVLLDKTSMAGNNIMYLLHLTELVRLRPGANNFKPRPQ